MNGTERTSRLVQRKNQPGAALHAACTVAVDWFLPSHVRVGELDSLRRARLVVAFGWTLISLAIIYAAILRSMNSPVGAAALILGASLGAASLCIMRWTGSYLMAGNLMTAAFLGTLTVLAYRLGGHGTPSLAWYAGVPVVALSTVGRRAAACWFVVTLAALVAFYMVHASGHTLPIDLDPPHFQLLGLVSWIGLIALILGLALAYETAVGRTLSELRTAEERLLRERDFSDSAIASLPGIFYLFDNEGRYLRWNENLQRVSGYSPAELSRMHPLDFFAGQDRCNIERCIEEVFRAGQSTTEARFTAKDGTTIPYLFSGRRLILDGKPHLVGMGIDIADRKQAEEALREAREFLEAAVAQSPSGILIADAPDVRIRLANDAAFSIRGGKRDDLTDIAVSQHAARWRTCRMDGSPYPAEQLPLSRAILQGETVRNEEVIIHDAEGDAHWVNANAAPIRDTTGRVTAGIVVFHDITAQKKIETELAGARDKAEAATRAKSEFLANMSHEIRTPMTAILGFSEVLAASVTHPDQLDAARTIKQNGEYLLGIINDILDLSKIEAGKLAVEQVPCSPCQLLSEVVSLMRERANAKNLTLEMQADGPLPHSISSDPTRLRQILINLVANAIKFTEVGLIRVVARLADVESGKPKMQFDVIDSGIGMTDQQIAELFKPFSQLDTSATRKHGGTGLGLTISKRLSTALGGDISVSSHPGKGSTFTVTVAAGPLDGVRMLAKTAETQLPAEPVKRLTDLHARLACRVLLAEDGKDNQRLIAFLLGKAGAEVTLAENGQIAHDLALAAQDAGTPFHVILMDMQMPVMDGYEATRRLRDAGYAGSIIALTAHAMSTDRDKCLQSGCDEYLAKPVQRHMLISLVSEYATARTTGPTQQPSLACRP